MSQRQVPELKKEDPESLYNWLAYKVSCPEFRNPIKSYIDENCSTFVDIDENSFEQGQLFNELNLLIENLLKDVLEEGKITQEEFLKAAERGMTDKKYKKYFNQIINFGDYQFFKSVMTKRNFQIIKLAEQQMKQGQNAGGGDNNGQNINPDIIQKLLANEQNEIDEAIKQSLIDEEEKRKIAIIEEEEIKRAIKRSLEEAEAKKEQKLETKKEVIKKIEQKKDEPKKFVPNIISNNINFQFSGEAKPKEDNSKKMNDNPTDKVISSNKGFQLQVDSKKENFGFVNEPKNQTPNFSYPTPNKTEKKKQPHKYLENPYKEKEEKEEKTYTNRGEDENQNEKEKEKENIINEEKNPEKQERITREFVNIFEEKKLTLAPLVNKSTLSNPYKNEVKRSTLQEDLIKGQKERVQKDIERMNIKNEIKTEEAKDIIKNVLQQENLNQNQNFVENQDDDAEKKDDDIGGLLIDDLDEEEVISNDTKDKNYKSGNINLGKIEIPKDFNDKIPDYDKEKQEKLKDYRDMVLKKMAEEREMQMKNK